MQSPLAGLLSMCCFPVAQDRLSFPLRPVNHPEESPAATSTTVPCCRLPYQEVRGPTRGAPSMAGSCRKGSVWPGMGQHCCRAWQPGLGPPKDSSFAGKAPGSSSARSRDDGQGKAQGGEEEAGGSAPRSARLQPSAPYSQTSGNTILFSLPPSQMLLSS